MAISRVVTLGAASTLISLTIGSPGSSIWDTRSTQRKRVTCEDVHIFLGRGWNEDYPGRQGALVDAICAGQDSGACGYEDIIFDDSEGTVYGTAVYEGATAGISQVTDYAADCPDAKLVLSGYSEGAHVVGDVLAGGGGDFFDTTEDSVTGLASVSTTPGSQIAAALLWGDVRHTASQSYNVLSGANASGYYPRTDTNLDNLNLFSSVLRSYCFSGDQVCAQGDEDGVHTSYFEDSVGLVDDAASWVRSMVGMDAATATTSTATVQADSPATDGAAVTTPSSVAASSSSSSSSGDLTTVTGTANLATATGEAAQATSGSATALGDTSGEGSSALSTATSSPSTSGVGRVLGQGVAVTGSFVAFLGTAWMLLQTQ